MCIDADYGRLVEAEHLLDAGRGIHVDGVGDGGTGVGVMIGIGRTVIRQITSQRWLVEAVDCGILQMC